MSTLKKSKALADCKRSKMLSQNGNSARKNKHMNASNASIPDNKLKCKRKIATHEPDLLPITHKQANKQRRSTLDHQYTHLTTPIYSSPINLSIGRNALPYFVSASPVLVS